MRAFLFVCFLAAVAAERRLIKAPKVTPRAPLLPDLARGLFPGNDTWSAGYVSFPAAGTTFHFFYWMLNSRNDPANDPTLIWLTGGPGCSSSLALLAENGAWQDFGRSFGVSLAHAFDRTFADPNSVGSLMTNPYSWSSRANVIFVDNPVGTGFSYADRDVYERNEDEVAADMYLFVQGFYKLYPLLLKNKLFVSGESYGGHYVPAVSSYIVTMNQKGGNVKLPFAGCEIGNGLVNPLLQYPQYANYCYANGLISKFDVEKYAVEMAPCKAAIASGAYTVAYGLCNVVMQGILAAAGIRNVYNIKAGCPAPPLCYSFAAATTFLNDPKVQAALNVPHGITWESCNFDVNRRFSSDWMHSMADRLLNVLAANHTVLVMSGQLDFICNYFGGRAWTAALPWPGQTGFNAASRNPWVIKLANGTNYNAGVSQVYRNFAWLEVANAGHMVPMDQPQAALQLINRFLNNGWTSQ